jgi:hypothetical protein
MKKGRFSSKKMAKGRFSSSSRASASIWEKIRVHRGAERQIGGESPARGGSQVGLDVSFHHDTVVVNLVGAHAP